MSSLRTEMPRTGRRFVFRRLMLMGPTFIGMTFLTFVLARVAPGDPLAFDDERATAALGELRPSPAPASYVLTYLEWVWRVLHFDLGQSLIDRRPVAEKLGQALGPTLAIAGAALVIAFAAAVPVGVWLSQRRRRLSRRLVSVGLMLTWSVPAFWLAILLLGTLANPRALSIFPYNGLPGGPDVTWTARLWHLVLPVFCLALPMWAVATRQLGDEMAKVFGQHFILAARARGLPHSAVVWNHALRAAVIPFTTQLGLSIPHALGGSVAIERVFGVPGMGTLALEAVLSRDYATVIGVATVVGLVTMFSTLLIDLIAGAIDPRLAAERTE
jgi:peptide/nickel transport system permease protein